MRFEHRARLAEPVQRQTPQKFENKPQLGRFARLVTKNPDDGQVQRLADPPQQLDRNIALAAFELSEVALRQARIPRQDLARHATPRAFLTHPFAEAPQVTIAIGGG